MPGLAEVADGGAKADAVGIVQWHSADAGGVRMVVVRGIGEVGVPAGVVEGALNREPLLPLEASGDYWAVGSVKVAVEVCIGLKLPKVGEQPLEAPLIVAEGRPRVVVFGARP